jgi:hypothetical protein
MKSKKINLTIPEKNLKEIEDFCRGEGISKSFLIREAASLYIAGIKEKRELERRKKDMEWAIEASSKLRDKSRSFKDGKQGSDAIRQSRDKEH